MQRWVTQFHQYFSSETADDEVELTALQLKDPSLFKQQAYVNGKWIDAKSGKTFEVHGELDPC